MSKSSFWSRCGSLRARSLFEYGSPCPQQAGADEGESPVALHDANMSQTLSINMGVNSQPLQLKYGRHSGAWEAAYLRRLQALQIRRFRDLTSSWLHKEILSSEMDTTTDKSRKIVQLPGTFSSSLTFVCTLAELLVVGCLLYNVQNCSSQLHTARRSQHERKQWTSKV